MTIPEMHKAYSFTFEIMVTGAPTGEWRNIAHVTKGGSNSNPGDRMPLISLYPDENRLHISSYVNGVVNYACNTQIETKLDTWYKFEIKQVLSKGKYLYSVLSDSFVFDRQDKSCKDVENTTPIELSNMKVYASDPWGNVANAKIRHFTFSTTCKNQKLKLLVKLDGTCLVIHWKKVVILY